MPKSQLAMYIENQDSLLKEHEGQIIAVKNGQCLGAYPDKLTAYRDMQAKGLRNSEYIIIKCTPGDSAYTMRSGFWRCSRYTKKAAL